ncbi:hypothetical protein F4679DRAFT_584895 [Xylaria curta]|nr:hypothetical protein F4679DRAFT_584895 [Xylaria curta]
MYKYPPLPQYPPLLLFIVGACGHLRPPELTLLLHHDEPSGHGAISHSMTHSCARKKRALLSSWEQLATAGDRLSLLKSKDTAAMESSSDKRVKLDTETSKLLPDESVTNEAATNAITPRSVSVMMSMKRW